MTELTPAEAMRSIAEVPYGRIVFTVDSVPAIRVVNHVVDGDRVVFRTHPAGGIAAGLAPFTNTVVAYEADDIDPVTRTGWSAIVTGTAHPVTDLDELVEYTRVLTPWVGGPRNAVVAIEPSSLTGFRLD